DGLVGVRCVGTEQRAEILVQLRGDEVEPFLDAIALLAPGGRNEPGAWRLVGDVLDDGRPFGQAIAVVERQHRDLALGVDLQKMGAVFGFLGAEVDLLELERDAGFAQHDVRGERTGSRREIKLHEEMYSWSDNR